MLQRLKTNKEDCCGCGACIDICPKNIITMQKDDEGFYYPYFDVDSCIHCDLCKKTCPLDNQFEESGLVHRSYVFKNTNEERMHSTSGAAFPALASEMINKKGKVVGVALEDDLTIKHRFASTQKEMQAFRNSKYVQSDMAGVFAKIAEESMNNKIIFFGLPCQSEALRLFLKYKRPSNPENVIICDLICGKCTSPGVWKDYVSFLQDHYQGKIGEFIFRDKNAGWAYAKPKVVVDGKDVSKEIEKKYNWMELYTHSEFCRMSCYFCKFSTPERLIDITIGDFWGIENTDKKLYDDKGVSLVITHTTKGNIFFNTILNDNYIVKETKLSESLQDRLRFPTPKPLNRESFWEDYKKLTFFEFMNKYASMSNLKIIIYGKLLPYAKRIGIYNTIWRLTHKKGNKKA